MKKHPLPPARSPSIARREREKEETRRLILGTARALFTREGYQNTTMRAIAERIGYTATAIYHYFADKESLVMELCRSDFGEMAHALISIGRVGDPIERIRQMGRAYVRFAVEHPEQFRFMFLVERPMPHAKDVHMDPNEDGYQFLLGAVKEAIAQERFRPEFRDADIIAQTVWGLVHGISALHVTKPDSGLILRDALETTDVAAEAMLLGLLHAR
jgi:AcrR family transcriptional regulator